MPDFDPRAKLKAIREILEDDTHNDHLAIVGIVELLESELVPASEGVGAIPSDPQTA